MPQLSIWEKESFYAPADVIIAGGGFTGLWSAYYLKKNNPALRVTVIDKGIIPTGASTRNAGFACFGSATELLGDAASMGADKMLALAEMRFRGIERIRSVFGDNTIDFENNGGYELIDAAAQYRYPDLPDRLRWLNEAMAPVAGTPELFRFADEKIASFGFRGIERLILTPPESQLHSGKLCLSLLQTVHAMGVIVLAATEIIAFEEAGETLAVITGNGTLTGRRLLICTNAFTKTLLPRADITPARGQVLLTSPIPGLRIKGTFHFDEGYYYFRNLGNRLLLGGARNKAADEETTTEMDISQTIQDTLERFMKDYLLPEVSYSITDRWSGIMAMGSEKMPLVAQLTPLSFCAVRMSGMGVALAPVAAEEVAKLIIHSLRT